MAIEDSYGIHTQCGKPPERYLYTTVIFSSPRVRVHYVTYPAFTQTSIAYN